MKKRRELDHRTFAQNAANQSSLIQLITGMQEIKLNSCEKQKRWEWERIQAKLFNLGLKGLALGQYQEAGGTLINQLKNIIVTFIAANAVISGDLTLGMMLSVQYIIGQLNSPVNLIIGFIQQTQDARISLERLSEIHTKKDEDDLTESTKQNFSLKDIENSWIGRENSPCIFISAKDKTNIQEFREMIYATVKRIYQDKYPFSHFLY